jgi:hypothetical protein
LIIEYLVMKLALQAVVDECNRMALEQESRERVRFLRSGIARLEVAYESGLIDGEEYGRQSQEILDELKTLSQGQSYPLSGGAT